MAPLLSFKTTDRASLASAFSNLAENDQYDAVLTGLCAKILDDTSEEKAISSLQDPVSLVVEMNGRNVKASGRSLMALIDVSLICCSRLLKANLSIISRLKSFFIVL